MNQEAFTPAPLTPGDQLAAREVEYKARRAEADAFVRGLIQFQIQMSSVSDKYRINAMYIGNKVWNPFRDGVGNCDFTDAEAERRGGKNVDPWDHYGKAFCESLYVTLALDYLRKTPVAAKHPLYPAYNKGFTP